MDRMSPLGYKQTFSRRILMSALPPKADMADDSQGKQAC